MLDAVYFLVDRDNTVMILTFVAVTATILTFALPMLDRDQLVRRMKATTVERDKIRARERAKLVQGNKPVSLRSHPKAYMRNVVETLNLTRAFTTDGVRDKLKMAGYRGEAPLFVYLFFRVVLPVVLFLVALIYMFLVGEFDQPPMVRVGIAIGAAYVGFFLPDIFLSNVIQKRQTSIKRAFPDALDLLLICVESGMSVEAAFKKVSDEIGLQSVPLAEELTLTTAELSYLSDRRQAYENLSKRTGLDGVKAVCTSLIQAERYGTPVGTALRVMAQENRDMRMAEAEKKAAGLPPKLTVPMILFFLPCLFVVILGPAVIRVMAL